MTVAINKRSAPPPRDPANRPTLEAMLIALNELGGVTGGAQRAIRVCELVDAGLLQINPAGLVIAKSPFPNPAFSGVVTVGNQSAGGVGILRLEDAVAARLGWTASATRRWSAGNNGTSWTLRDESGATDRLTVGVSGANSILDLAAGAFFFNSIGTAPSGSFASISSPGSVPGIVGQYGTTKRRDIRFSNTGIELGASPNAGSPTIGLILDDSGRLYGTALHNNAAGVAGATNQYIASGTYTPTVTAGTNCGAASAQVCSWLRVGNVVVVCGRVDAATTAAANTATTALVSLPIATTLSNAAQLAGGGGVSYAPRVPLTVIGDTATGKASFGWNSSATASTAMTFIFSYVIN